MLEIRTHAKLAVLGAAAAMATAHSAHGQGHLHGGDDGPRSNLSCGADAMPSVHCGSTPTAAFDRDGRLWVTFAQAEHVYVTGADSVGGNFETAVRVNDAPEPLDVNGENRPKIAFGVDGELYVSWTKKVGGGYNGDIRFSRSLDRGRTFTPPVTVNDDGITTGHRFESMHVDPVGDLYIAWLDKRDLAAAAQGGTDYVGAAVYYTVSADGGASFAGNRRVAGHSCECCRIAMTDVAGERGPGAAIFWRHVFGERTRDHAFAVLGPESVESTARRATHDDWEIDACPHHGPAMTPAIDGSYHLAWFTAAAQRKGVYYGRFTPGDTPENTGENGPESAFMRQLKSVAPSAGAGHPSLSSSNGRLHLAWKEFDGEATNVKVIVSSDEGQTWSPAGVIAQTQGASDHPFLLSYGARTFLSWHTETEGLRIMQVNPHSNERGETP